MDLANFLEPAVVEAGIIAFASLFALIDPVGNAVMFASLTANDDAKPAVLWRLKVCLLPPYYY